MHLILLGNIEATLARVDGLPVQAPKNTMENGSISVKH